MRSEGQEWASNQLQEIASASGGVFELFQVAEPEAAGSDLTVIVSVLCGRFERRAGGIRYRKRERLRIVIPSAFPLSRPSAYFSHKDYADFPHVQWGDYICLYQAPDVEWQASRGMFGFMGRLEDWLKAGALGELDPTGMPLHPPVAYSVGNFKVIPHENTPRPAPPYWCGYAKITRENDHVAHLGEWLPLHGETPTDRVAAAILLPEGMPHEYPTSMLELLKALVARGVPIESLRAIMTLGVLLTPEGKRAIFVLGAAMRGTAGGERRQHLASWCIEGEQTDKLRAATTAATPENPIDVATFYEWAFEAKVEWCQVFEDRTEIVERRDSQSAGSWWNGKSVAILGCGAIGSAVAVMLARANVARLQLFDHAAVRPGVLVRQGFHHDHVGFNKSSATKVAAEWANPNVIASWDHRNILDVIKDKAALDVVLEADVIIDASASSSVAAALEYAFRGDRGERPPVVTMALGHNADFGLMTVAPRGSVGLSIDLDRRAKIALSGTSNGGAVLEEFWPSSPERRQPFQPEPGCSSPTFRGSYADVLGISSRMTNVAATWLAKAAPFPRMFAMDLSGGGIASGPARELEFAWRPYATLPEARRGYQVRITDEAMKSILTWVRRSERTHRDKTETGGVLFGQIDEFLKVIWIDEASGPPSDSRASPTLFLCGTMGVKELTVEKVERTRGSTNFVGMWHTHPQARPDPSRTDLASMQLMLQDDTYFEGRNFLMLIVGGTSRIPAIAAGLFRRSDYAQR